MKSSSDGPSARDCLKLVFVEEGVARQRICDGGTARTRDEVERNSELAADLAWTILVAGRRGQTATVCAGVAVTFEAQVVVSPSSVLVRSGNSIAGNGGIPPLLDRGRTPRPHPSASD